MFRKILITLAIVCFTFTPVMAADGSFTSYISDTFSENGLIGGPMKMIGDGICAVTSLLFGDCSSGSQSALNGLNGTTLNGGGAMDGLDVFKDNYKGNTYGSAIGMITGWTNFVLPFVSAIAVAALVYAGFLYLTSFGNEEQSGKAKKIIMWVVIGIILIVSSYAIVNTLIETDGSGGDDDDFSLSVDVGGVEVDIN